MSNYPPPPAYFKGVDTPKPQGYTPPPQPSYNPFDGPLPQQQYHPQHEQHHYQASPPPPLPPPPLPPQQQFNYAEPKQEVSFQEVFKVSKPKYNDLWAAVLFLLTFLGMVAVSVLATRGYSGTKSTSGNGVYSSLNKFSLNANTIALFGFVLGVSLASGFAYLLTARKFPRRMIWAMGIANIILGIGTAVYYLYRKYYSAGIIFLISAIFYAFCFWSWRSRIPFSVIMLEVTIDVARKWGHVFMVSAIGGFVALAAAAWFAVATISTNVKWTPDRSNPACGVSGGGCSKGKVVGVIVFLVFGFYWLSEVIKNVIHTTISGVYGSWYFCSKQEFPRHATIDAFERSMSYSFGSICFGSLIVAIIQFLRHLTSLAEQDTQGNILMECILCCIRCFLSVIQSLVEYFNHYAYSYIALYGEAYVPSAKTTWRMMKDRGFDTFINDCLIDAVLTMGSVAVGFLCALLSYLYLEFTNPLYNKDGSYTPLILAFAFLIGLQVANIFLVPIKSGVATIFIAMAYDPDVLLQDHPDLYQKIVAVYPHVQQMIHV